MKGFHCLVGALALLMYSATASSVEVKSYLCTATHHSVDAAGNDKVTMVGKKARVTDIGTSFTVSIGDKKIYSSSLIPFTKNGQKMMMGKMDETYYTKQNGSYVIENKGEGYVVSDCK